MNLFLSWTFFVCHPYHLSSAKVKPVGATGGPIVVASSGPFWFVTGGPTVGASSGPMGPPSGLVPLVIATGCL